MTEEELKQKIADEVIRELPYPYEDDPIPESIANQILTLIREAGYMSPDMVKGLMFEAQAKKCASCPKNQGG